MTHPFEKMLMKALGKSTLADNQVLEEAERLLEKGYRPEEIYTLLKNMKMGLIDPADEAIAADALEDFSEHVDLDD